MTKSLRRISGILFAIALAFMIGGASLLVPNAMDKAYADESGYTVLAFTSDIHNQSSNVEANRLGTWIDKMHEQDYYGSYGGIDVMAFGGDMASARVYGDDFWTYTQANMTMMTQKGVDPVYTTGNHEYMNGSYTHSASSSTQQQFVEDSAVRTDAEAYHMYCLGTSYYGTSQQWNAYGQQQIADLNTYLSGIDDGKPIFIITHYPLHWTSSRSISRAGDIIDLLNEHADAGRKIVFLWGHNHTDANRANVETHYDEIFAPGEELKFGSASSDTRTLKFYYAAAGCMSGSEYGDGSGAVKGKGLIVTVNSKNQLSFAYYDEFGNNVTEDGTGGQGTAFTEQDPVAVTGVSINQISASVEVGKTTKLTATVEPADATNKAVTWSSSDEGIARVGADGRVRGISEGTATITVTAGDPDTRAIYTASIDVEVTPKSGEEDYFVITIDNYALTSLPSSETLSNSSGYVYYGLQTLTYNANDDAPWSILWTLEEVDGVENGYYIKSYNGEYLSATYAKEGSQNGYTGRLNVGDFQDIWVVTSGLETWQDNGSYLKSTNASVNPRDNTPIYLTTRASDNSVDFFTVGSSSNYKTTKLVEPEGIIEPISVSGIEVEPSELEIEAGKSTTLTANVLPAEADDKTVTWTSSDESVATVSNSGRVKGISEGTCTITATTNDGHYTDTCEVTVIPSSAPGIGYVITIDGYALSTEPADTTLTNSTNYHYSGLAGVPYTSTTEQTEEILWLIEPTTGGYYIKSQDGQYLNAVYEATTNPTGCNAVLKVDDTPDVWTFNGTLEDWVVSGSLLKSTNADKYLNFEMEDANLNLFDVRSESNAHSSSMIDPDNPAEVRYVETDSLSTGRDYIVAVTKDGSSVYAIDNVSGTSSADTGTATFGEGEYFAASGGEAAYIVTDNTSSVWNYNSSRYLVNNTRYLSRGGSSGAYVPRASGSGSAVTYDGSNQRLSISYSSGWGSGTTYYLTNSSGTFGLNTSSSSAAQVRVFGKTSVFNFKYVVQFTANGVNYQSSKYATDEIPVYSGVTPTRADSEQYSYTFSGWSADGGQTIYGPDEALPAVTGPVTYVAQFTAVPKPTGHTVTFVDVSGDEPVVFTTQTVADGEHATALEEDPTKEGCYAFGGWYADKELNTPFDFENTAITADTTIYAKWNDAHTLTAHEAVPTTCTETGTEAYWSCSVCNKLFSDEAGTAEITAPVIVPALGHNMTEHAATAAACTEPGNSAYWSCDRCNKFFSNAAGTTEIDENSWVISATGHAYGEPTYTWADDNSQVTATRTCGNDSTHVETEDAAVTSEVTTQPTCTEMGKTTYTATFTNSAFATQTKTLEDVAALGHDWDTPTYTWADDHSSVTAERVCKRDATHKESETAQATGAETKPSTCEAKGETTYTSAAFQNSAFEIQTETVADIDALGHDYELTGWTWTGSDAAGWTAATATFTCKNDSSHVQTVNAVLAAETTAATCTADGSTVYTATATFEDKPYTDSKTVTIAATGHDWGEVTYAWNDANTQVTATRICGNDSAHVDTETANATSEVTTQPTCTEMGKTTYTATFTNSAFEPQTKTLVDVPATGHAYGAPTYEWAADHSTATATRTCYNDSAHVETEDATVTSAVTKQPTCEAKGETTYTATFANSAFATQTETVADIDATGHAWGEVSYTWADDNSQVTATRTCGNDSTHVETEDAAVTSEVTTQPTCTEMGKTTYTATFTNSAFATQTKTLEDVAALGHDWDTPTYTWADDHSSVTAERVCKRDATHKESETAQATGAETKPSTCEAKGETTYTSAAFQNSAFEIQTETVADIDALGHDYELTGWTWTGSDAAGWTAATATFTCKNDSSHVQTVNAVLAAETTAATCTADGSTVYTATATFEDKPYTDSKTVTIAATGHDWGEVTYAWNDANTQVTATRICGNDSAHVDTETANATSEVTTQPTCTEMGKTTYTATFTNSAFEPQTKTLVDVPATGHAYGAPTYEWAADHSTATATRTCYNDSAHVETEDATVTSAVTKQPTCEAKGETTYTATFANSAFATQTETVADIDATGHAWGAPVWTWTGDEENGFTAASSTFTCANDSAHTSTAADTVIDVATVEATPNTNGSKTYTASVTGPDGKAYEDAKVVTIQATGYSWKDAVYTWNETADGFSCTALKECNEDPEQNIAETVDGVYAVTEPATCEGAGTGTYTATFGNAAFEPQTMEVEIPATGHDYVATVTESTCTEGGYTTHACSRCGDSYTDTQTEALGHDWGEWTVTAEPTCEAAGTETRECSRCDEAETREVEALGHAWDDGKVTVQPTETSKGEMTYTCERCGETKTEPIDELEPTKNGWIKEGSGWKYYSGGKAVNGWQKLPNGKWYHFTDTVMDHGWFKETSGKYAGKWFHLGYPGNDNTGWMVTGWLKVDGYWYYLKPTTGEMQTGWKDISGKRYYFDANGRMAAEKWVKDSGGWVYLGKDGAMATNKWVMDSVGWCYVGEDGYAVASQWKRDSVGWCYLDEKCRLAIGWKEIEGEWYYFDNKGRMATDRWVKDSVGWCYLGSDGRAVASQWRDDSVGRCYLDEKCRLAIGWKDIDGKTYWFDSNGRMATGERVIDGVAYTFGDDGALVGGKKNLAAGKMALGVW